MKRTNLAYVGFLEIVCWYVGACLVRPGLGWGAWVSFTRAPLGIIREFW